MCGKHIINVFQAPVRHLNIEESIQEKDLSEDRK